MAMRVPVVTGSVVDLTVDLSKTAKLRMKSTQLLKLLPKAP